ncbi:HTH_48 domain-containing protein [Trichonephila clavata]|uniref:HTH_48 domain-containing protein n=1 Tax=Trichonephila clavata TaxID=2740835 RepID=A0A8X6G936_TRICU|nr:HTH_48 domain-containing protein [Trichonephila clavata]
MLTDLHKTQRLGSALTFLERYHNEGEDFLDQIVTGDETWVAYVTPESKQQSMEWRHSSSPKRVKFKQTISARKIMCTIFWDRKGVLLVEFLPRNETINAASYYTFTNVSPFLIEKAISGTIGTVKTIRKMRSGNLFLEVSSSNQATILAKLQNLAHLDVTVSPHGSLNFSFGVISPADFLNGSSE